MEEEKKQYEIDLEINAQKIDAELLDQPKRYMKYLDLLADAGNVVKQTTKTLEIVRAELSLSIREDRTLSDSAISNKLVIQKEFQFALDEHNKAIYKFNQLQGVVKAFEQRQASLGNIVNIVIHNYTRIQEDTDNVTNFVKNKRKPN